MKHVRTRRPPALPILESLEGRRLLSVAAEASVQPALVEALAVSQLSVQEVRQIRAETSPPGRPVAQGVSPTRIHLAWRNSDDEASVLRIQAKTLADNRWRRIGAVAPGTDDFIASGLQARTRYYFRIELVTPEGVSVYSRMSRGDTLRNQPGTSVAGPDLSKVAFSGPLVITEGGVYRGHWQSLNPYVPAISVQTDEPVIIEDSIIRSRGNGISGGHNVNLIVRDTFAYGLNPNVLGRHPGRFISLDYFRNVVIENNYLEGTSGIYLNRYAGDYTPNQTIRVLRNVARNIDGRFSNGVGGYLTGPDDNYLVQFFQTNTVQNIRGAEVAWNQVFNEPGKSRVEENINIFDSSGTPDSPFRIHDNYIQGSYPADITDGGYNGGGIMLSDVRSHHIWAYNNQLVATGSNGIIITSGHDNRFFNNRMVSSGLLPNGTTAPWYGTGAVIWNYNNETTFVNNFGYNNVIGWVRQGHRNDTWFPNVSSPQSNTFLPDPITLVTEAAEWTMWQNKLAGAKVLVGPRG